MWEAFRVVLWLSQWFRIVSFDSVALFLHPSKASVGMYSRCLCQLSVASRWEVPKFARAHKVLAMSFNFKVADKEGCPGSSVSLQVVNWLLC